MSFFQLIQQQEVYINQLSKLPLFKPPPSHEKDFLFHISKEELAHIISANEFLYGTYLFMKNHRIILASHGDKPLFEEIYRALRQDHINCINYIEYPHLFPLVYMKYLIELARKENFFLLNGKTNYVEITR